MVDITNFKQKKTYFLCNISSAEDIKKFNKLQYFNCNHVLFFENDSQKNEVLKIIRKNEMNREKMGFALDRKPLEKGELIHTYREGINEKIDFSFLEIIRGKTGRIVRSEMLSKWYDNEINRLRKETEKQKRS